MTYDCHRVADVTATRKHPSAAFWITVVAVLVGYPLSFGPWCWIGKHGFVPEWMVRLMETFYWPLALATGKAILPRPVTVAGRIPVN